MIPMNVIATAKYFEKDSFSLNNKNKLQVVKEPTKKINTDSIKKVEELRKKQQEKSFDEMSKIF